MRASSSCCQRFDEDLAAEVRDYWMCLRWGAAQRPLPTQASGWSCGARSRARDACELLLRRRGCRRRATPPSLRFLGRKVFFGVLVLLIPILREGPTPERLRRLEARFGVSRRTLYRWRRWWRETVPRSRWWQQQRGLFAGGVDGEELPDLPARRVWRHRADRRPGGRRVEAAGVTASGSG